MKRIDNVAFEQKAVTDAVFLPARSRLRSGEWRITLECGHANIFHTHPGDKSFCRQCINEHLAELKVGRALTVA